jgi:hypothetical protein
MIYDVHKAVPVSPGVRDVPNNIINITSEFPDEHSGPGWQKRAREIHERDADLVVEALTNGLPGGTLYRVMTKLFARHVENAGGYLRVVDDAMQGTALADKEHALKLLEDGDTMIRPWWNFVEGEGGVVWVCEGNHDKGASCRYRPATSVEATKWRAQLAKP